LHLSEPSDNGWIFAHNGFVSNYSTVSDKSDSFYFFRALLKLSPELDNDAITKMAQKKGFSGRAVLYNPISKNMVLIAGSSPIYIMVIGSSLIFSTQRLASYRSEWVHRGAQGLTWFSEKKRGKIKIKHRDKKENYIGRLNADGFTDEKNVQLSATTSIYQGYGKGYGANGLEWEY